MAVMIGLIATSALVQAAEPAPDWTLTSAQGEATRLSAEVRQQPVVLFFWATWCPYCKAFMPHLQSIRLEHGDEVKVLAISFVEKGDPVGFVKDLGYDFTVLPGGDDVASIYGVYGTPGVILVDQEQQIRFDLRSLPPHDLPESAGKSSHKKKAAYIAPYWAAELRKSIDSVLDESTQ
jgi:cytochrome c biogenesis protein CcmG, thiol:disulfide interchange protein DsbE